MAVLLLSIDRVAPLIAIVRRQGSPPSPAPSPHSLTQEIRGWWYDSYEALATQAPWALHSPLPPGALGGVHCTSTVPLYCAAVFIVVCLSGGDV